MLLQLTTYLLRACGSDQGLLSGTYTEVEARRPRLLHGWMTTKMDEAQASEAKALNRRQRKRLSNSCQIWLYKLLDQSSDRCCISSISCSTTKYTL